MISDTIASVVIGAFMGAAGDHAALYQGQIEPSYQHAVWTTHPYWGDEEFHVGDICYDGTLYTAVPMRYNILDNRLVVTSPVGKLAIMPDQEKISWLQVEGRQYVRQGGRLMQVVHGGDNVTLLHAEYKYYGGDVPIGQHYYREVVSESHYYVLTADGTLREVDNLRSLRKLMPQHRTELRRLAKQHGLRFGHQRREESLRQCVALMDGLQASETNSTNRQPGEATTTYRLADYTDNRYDSLYTTITEVSEVEAFGAYTPGSEMIRRYADDVETSDTPGIERLEVLHEARTLEEVQVLGMHSKLTNQLSGVEAFRPALLRNIPLAMGEADVLKIALKMPGVSSTGEAASGINVRGGATEQTLILKDGNTVWNPMHMFGLFSAFNPDLVAETELYKGSIPSQYGGRLSSVMNIKSRVPDRKEWHGSASIGLVTAKAMVELPLVEDRVSMMVGGRATYSDWMLKLMPKEEPDDYYDGWLGGGPAPETLSTYRDGTAGYWDLGGTLNAQLDKRHTLVVNGYYSHDRFALTQEQRYAYANMNASAELRSHYDERLSTTLTAGYDHYDYKNDDTGQHYAEARLHYDLNHYFVKGVADYQYNDEHTLNAGVESQYYHIMPGEYLPLGDDSEIIAHRLNNDNGMESALWLEDNWTLSPRWKVTGGVRLNLFTSMKEGMQHTYVAPDVRLSGSYAVSDNASVKMGLNTMHQFVHKVSNTVIMSPTDTWMLSNTDIKPQRGWQLSAGYYLQTGNRDYELSAEAYYKGMDHYLTYRDAAILVMNDHLERDVVGTEGRAYGIELQMRKLYGRLNGWLSYTYARTLLRQRGSERQTPINHGAWYAADYDSPHDVKLVCNFKFTRRYSTSLNAEYSTGRPFTAPIGTMPTTDEEWSYVPIYSDRNTYRMPDYMRVDWAFNIEPSHHLTALTHSWLTIGVYNLLGRRNAYSIYFDNYGSTIRGHQISIFGAPIPYINYNIKF